jgi:predicted acetyltransferase
MASFYADYLTEKTNDDIIETDFGFVTYRHLPEQLSTYIIDLYVIPEKRHKGFATYFVDEVSKKAKEKGFKKILGTCVPSNHNSTESLKAILSYGMDLKSSSENLIIFEKRII